MGETKRAVGYRIFFQTIPQDNGVKTIIVPLVLLPEEEKEEGMDTKFSAQACLGECEFCQAYYACYGRHEDSTEGDSV